ARAGPRAPHLGCPGARGPHFARSPAGGRDPRVPGRAQRHAELPHPGRGAAQGAVYGRGGAARSGGGNGGRSGARRRPEADGAARAGFRDETHGRGSHALIDTVSLRTMSNSENTTPVILSACRTPIGRYLGGLSA